MIPSSSAIMLEDADDMTLNFGEENNESQKLTKRHPVAIFFHIIFRVLALLGYLLFGLFTSGFIVTFVIIVVFLAFDFWTTKNITGRLLVGLRWWNYVDEEGKSHWVYESRKPGLKNITINNSESNIFWISLIVSQIFWVVFVMAALLTLKFQWFMVACIGLSLNGANLYGYIRCKLGSSQKLKSNATSFLGQQVLTSMIEKLTKQENPKLDTINN